MTFCIEPRRKRFTVRSPSRPAHGSITGLDALDKVIEIDQAAIGRTPRSNPATYTQVFTPIRDLYAMLPESRERGYKPGRFSFNVKGGRCEACQGDGLKRIEMNFLPDVYVTCDVCRGRRYNHETLQVKYKGYSIADLLEASVEDALGHAREHPADQGEARNAGSRRPGLSAFGPILDDAFGRRSAAHQAGARIEPPPDRQDALHSGRAHHRPAFRRHRQAAGSAAEPGGSGQYSGGDRASAGRDQDRRLDHRSGPGRRRKRGNRGRHAALPRNFCVTPKATPRRRLRPILQKGQAA